MSTRKSESLFENSEFVGRVIAQVKQAGMPVSVDYVSTNLNVNWASTRAVMFQLSMEGRLKSTKTTKSWIFEIPENEVNSEVASKA